MALVARFYALLDEAIIYHLYIYNNIRHFSSEFNNWHLVMIHKIPGSIIRADHA